MVNGGYRMTSNNLRVRILLHRSNIALLIKLQIRPFVNKKN